ncbi:MAG TPA: hypothetical protein VM692_09230, partial [Gammaproteobacteria bacterium]|nr:hypothetical protein [Gammaproteobacteria bacterium]
MTIRRAQLVAWFDAQAVATVDELVPLEYSRAGGQGLPEHVRAASALRRFNDRLVIVQDDVNALAVRDASGAVQPVLLPPDAEGRRMFDDAHGNKRDKLDLEACVTLPDGRLVAFGSGSLPKRERLVVWRGGRESPLVVDSQSFYRDLRAAITRGEALLNIEGAVVCANKLRLFHRGNDKRAANRTSANAIAEVDCGEFAAWLDRKAGASPSVASVTTVELGDIDGIPFGFTDAVA